MFADEPFVPGVAHDLNRVFFHLDFGCAVILRGCPQIHELWMNGVWWDLWLLAGGVVLGSASGIAAGIWCARRPRSRRAWLLEATAMGLIADAIVSRIDPRVRSSHDQAW
jgi:ABC-type dipeptide/oligopeptide/nickel transport system permease component